MRTRAAAKERSLLLLAAVCFASAIFLSPAVEASRGLPATLAPALTAPATLDQVPEAELSGPPERLRLFEDLRLPERPLELVEARKTASGPSTFGLGLNILKTGDLSRNCGGLSFQGLWTDPVTGISYARNRWYDARTASWLSEDPKGAVDSPNLYAFVGWGPHIRTDPFGLCWLTGDDVPCAEYGREFSSQFSSPGELWGSTKRSARFLGQEVVGAAQLVPETAKAAYQVVRHPVQTYGALNDAAANAYVATENFVTTAIDDPNAALEMAAEGAQDKLLDISSVDADDAGRATGKALVGIAAGGVTTKVVKSSRGLLRFGDELGEAAQDGMRIVSREMSQELSDYFDLDALKGRLHGHHTYPKAVGGHPNQVLAEVIDVMHTGKGGIHSELARFEGGWLRPRKGTTGAQIVEEFGQDAVEGGLRRFYSQDEWKFLLEKYESAVGFTRKAAEETALD